MMKLWLISQDENEGYDTFDSAVVAAETAHEAKCIHPSNLFPKPSEQWKDLRYSDWASSPDKVSAKYIGEAAENIPPGPICSSFNAG
jgi:hypothetical protein